MPSGSGFDSVALSAIRTPKKHERRPRPATALRANVDRYLASALATIEAMTSLAILNSFARLLIR